MRGVPSLAILHKGLRRRGRLMRGVPFVRIMKIRIHRFGGVLRNDKGKLALRGLPDGFDRLESLQQIVFPSRPHALDLVQNGGVALIAQGTLIADGSVVSLLLDVPHQGEDRLVLLDADLPPLGCDEGPGAVPVVLHHAEGGHAKAQILLGAESGGGVVLASVDEQQVGQGRKVLVPVRIALEAAVHRLVHAGVVVRPLQLLDAELPIVPLQGLAVHMDGHGGHDARVPQV